MAPAKYGKYVKSLPIKDYAEGGFRQGAELDSAWLGFDVNIKYGAFWTAGKIGKGPRVPHVHDYDQVLLFAGSDVDDIGELGAEVELCLGKEEERFIFNRSTAVLTPPFLPHWPGGLIKLERPIIMADIHPFGNDH